MKIITFLFYICCRSISGVLVEVDEGKLWGTSTALTNNRSVYAFYGVPFADPPVGDNRFEPPVPRKPWKGIWNASFTSNICLQYNQFTKSVLGVEDCLYMNIFTPELLSQNETSLKDVLVFFHGGAFMFGSGSYIVPHYIMKHEDLVFVSVNYRLNVFGFLSTNDSIVPGNNGLKDQIAALKWIQKNIIHFGGNPNSVTLFGSSAGGSSVHYHFISPLSEGLFHRAISASGSMLPPWTLPKNNSEKSIKLASVVGCFTVNKKLMLECLKSKPAKHLIEAVKNFQVWRFCPFTAFGPVVEPRHSDAFISDEPIELLKPEKIKKLPWLLGLCKDEGLYPAAEFIAEENSLKELDDQWSEIAPHLFMYNFSTTSETEKNKISTELRKFYFGDEHISVETIPQIIQMLGDRHFYNDIVDATRLHSAATNQSIFCYFFSYRGKYSQTNYLTKNNIDYGTSHADDIYYLLSIPYLNFYAEETRSDADMVKFMCKVFRSFMKTGKPALNGKIWKPVSKNLNDNLHCLNIKSSTVQDMIIVKNKQTKKLWQKLLPSEYASHFEISNRKLKDEL